MPSEIYVALSGQMAMETRLATLANNVANLRTAGFRAQTVNFETVMSDFRADRVNFATKGETHIDLTQGPVERTGNALDVAVVGGGFLGIETPAGTAYTRDGRLTLTAEGDVRTMTGHAVLDEAGAPMQVAPNGGPLTITADGRVLQNGAQAATLGLFALPADATLSRYGDAALLSDRPAEPIVERTVDGFRQGYREGSNVNAIAAIADLIAVQRAFDNANTTLASRQETLERAVRTLGSQ